MGCASSAALPFLTGRGIPTASESDNQNGKLPYELNNKLKSDAVNGVKDINETGASNDVKEIISSNSVVQGVINDVMDEKEEIVHQVQETGEAIVNNLSSTVDGIGDNIESTIGQMTDKVEEVEETVKSEIKGIGEKISSFIGNDEENEKEKEDDIDELLATLPDEEGDIVARSKATAEELIEAATEEVSRDEMEN